jgi:hypothetical protein
MYNVSLFIIYLLFKVVFSLLCLYASCQAPSWLNVGCIVFAAFRRLLTFKIIYIYIVLKIADSMSCMLLYKPRNSSLNFC